ncbi:MAG: ABC transporter substrate-binding protein [Campylobacterota bacterium]|nr:ABC transporter substrate-binding protein [Campylobacterota bacterium]
MKLKIFILSCLLGTTLFANQNTTNANLKLLTEDYKPISFQKANGEVDGLAIDIVKEIMKRLELKQEITLLDWKKAYELTKDKPNYVLFSAGKTKEREALFKWVGPIFNSVNSFYTKSDYKGNITNFNEAKKLDDIIVYRDSFNQQTLESAGFKNLEKTTKYENMIDRLLIIPETVIASSPIIIKAYMDKRDYPMNLIKRHANIISLGNYIMFSKSTPDAIINQWQKVLDDMTKEGFVKKIQDKWLK